VRRLVGAADRFIVDAGGIVGRHVGDGVVAFFPVEAFDSESAAAKECIAAARAIRAALPHVAPRSDLGADDIVARFGLHWGATLFMGAITTSGRTEVTALGDEANEAARGGTRHRPRSSHLHASGRPRHRDRQGTTRRPAIAIAVCDL
jgi:class 3 adenylate cyclase